MSSPGIKVEDNLCATGSGLALIGTALEQDSAYWEFHMFRPAKKHVDTILFGVSSKRDRKFYEDLRSNEKSEEEEMKIEDSNEEDQRKVTNDFPNREKINNNFTPEDINVAIMNYECRRIEVKSSFS